MKRRQTAIAIVLASATLAAASIPVMRMVRYARPTQSGGQVSGAVHADDRGVEQRVRVVPQGVPPKPDTVENPQVSQVVANLNAEQRGRIERSLAVLNEVEQFARNHGDRELLARVSVERGRLIQATIGVGARSAADRGSN